MIPLSGTSCSAEQRSTLRPKRSTLQKPFRVELTVEGSKCGLCLVLDHPAQFGGGGPAGAPAPEVDGQLSGQGHGRFLFERGAVFELLQKFLAGMPEGLPAQEPPDRFDQ